MNAVTFSSKSLTTAILLFGIVGVVALSIQMVLPSETTATGAHTPVLSIDDSSFTWSGPPALSYYTVLLCNGEQLEKVEMPNAADVETIIVGSRIKEVTAKGGTHYITKSADCPTTQQESAPAPIACPFAPKAGRTIVSFSGRIRSDKKESAAQTEASAVSLEPGIYAVSLAAWDGYVGRENMTQPREQYFVSFRAKKNEVARSQMSRDVPDMLREAFVADTVDYLLEIPSAVTSVVAFHAAYPDTTSPNSVNPICAAFDKKEEPAPLAPACPFAPKAGRTIVTFDDRIRSDKTQNIAQTKKQEVSLKKGVYSVSLASWDGYVGRENVTQPRESWKVVIGNTAGYISHTLPVSDVPDMVREALVVETVHDKNFTVVEDATHVYAFHAAYPDTTSPNSVNPVCVAFDIQALSEPEPTAPICTLAVTPTSITSDSQEVTLTWTSQHAVSASIDHGLGVVATTGATTTVPTSAKTYTLTVVGKNNQTVTCTAAVTRASGGGGSSTSSSGGVGPCLNCASRTTTTTTSSPAPVPTIEVAQEYVRATPGSFIYLDQIPYTGFEAGPLMTAVFWLGLLLVSAGISYLIVVKKALHRFVPTTGDADAHAAWQTYDEKVALPDRRFAAARQSTMVIATPRSYAFQMLGDARDEMPSDTEGKEVVERRAQDEAILFSPEALANVAKRVSEEGEDVLDTLFVRAKETYPREDGWILLSMERVRTLLDMRADASVVPSPKHTNGNGSTFTTRPSAEIHTTTSARQVPVERTSSRRDTRDSSVEQGTASEVTSATFVSWLVRGEQQHVFDHLRKISGQGSSPDTFIAGVVRELDEVYKNRIEGDRNPDEALVRETAAWTNGDFERVLGTLVESVDYSYQSSRVGAKVAIAKVFEYFAMKNAKRGNR